MYSLCLGGTSETRLDTEPQHTHMHCHIATSTWRHLDGGAMCPFLFGLNSVFVVSKLNCNLWGRHTYRSCYM